MLQNLNQRGEFCHFFLFYAKWMTTTKSSRAARVSLGKMALNHKPRPPPMFSIIYSFAQSFICYLFIGHNLLILCLCGTVPNNDESQIIWESKSKCHVMDWWCGLYCCPTERIMQLLKLKLNNLIQMNNELMQRQSRNVIATALRQRLCDLDTRQAKCWGPRTHCTAGLFCSLSRSVLQKHSQMNGWIKILLLMYELIWNDLWIHIGGTVSIVAFRKIPSHLCQNHLFIWTQFFSHLSGHDKNTV